MASPVLAEAKERTQGTLVPGIIDTITLINPILEYLPFYSVEGGQVEYSFTETRGGIMRGSLTGATLSNAAKTATTGDKKSVDLTRILGDVEIGGGMVDAFQRELGSQTMAKAEGIAEDYVTQFTEGDGTGNSFNGLSSDAFTPSTQQVAPGTNGDDITLERIDEVMSLVESKQGRVDFLMMGRKALVKFRSVLREANGASINETRDLPSGTGQLLTYNGAAIVPNYYIPEDVTQGTETDTTTIYAFNTDDGTMRRGVAGLNTPVNAGLTVEYGGLRDDTDMKFWRVGWTCSLANFHSRAVAFRSGLKV